MLCQICNSVDVYFSRIYNCSVCRTCEYIHIGKIFDNVAPFMPKKIRDKNRFDNKDRMFISLNMLGAQFSINQKILDSCYVKYDSCLRHGLLSGYTDDERAVSILYIIMHSFNQKVIIRDYCKFMDLDFNRCLTLAKHINKVIIITNYEKYLESFESFEPNEIKYIVERLDTLGMKNFTVTKNVIAAVAYDELMSMTQRDICDLFKLNIRTLKTMLKKVREV